LNAVVLCLLSFCCLGHAAWAADDGAAFQKKLKERITASEKRLSELEAQIIAAEGTPEQAKLLFAQAKGYDDLAEAQYQLALERGVTKAFDAPELVESRKKAIIVLDRILQNHAKHFDVAKALLLRARQNRHLGRYEDLARDLQTILVKHPKSQSVDDALMLLGDYYFDRTNLVNAKKLYQQLELHPKSPLLSYARYKLAWVAINGKDFQRAAELFVKVANAPTPKGSRAKTQGNLRLQALKDLVFCITEVMPPEKTLAYFQKLKLSRAEELQVLPALARRLWIKEHARAALAVYEHLISLADNELDRKDWKEQAEQIQKFLTTHPEK